MDGDVTYRGGIVRGFADFDLLPDLLCVRPTVEDWGRLLDAIGYNSDHVEKRFIPADMSLTEFMAGDALRFCTWIELIEPSGVLTASGLRLADIGGEPRGQRSVDTAWELRKTLAEQIQATYLGDDGLPLADMLQGACAVLASHGQIWPPIMGGLLLAEMDTLLHWGFVDAATARRRAGELPARRYRVIRAIREVPDALDDDGTVIPEALAETLAEVHWRDPELAQQSETTMTELKATAMAMTFSQLLSLTVTTPTLQVLRPWLLNEHGRD